MSTSPPKIDPETLALRGNPRRVVRFRRGLLIGIAGAGCLLVFAATWLALGTSSFKKMLPDTQFNVDRKPPADQLAALPSSYDQIKPPKLGSPLPGDLGPSVTHAERDLGLNPTDTSLRPNPEDDAARAERIRLAQQARQADESGVFFQVNNNPIAALQNAVTPATEPTPTPANASLTLDPAKDPNDQGRKLDFLSHKGDDAVINPHALLKPVSPYEVMAGTIISASLISGLNSDLPGLVIAQVTANVPDLSGRFVLIPQGARLLGTYDSVVAFGQSRALVVWQRIIMPDGSSIQIDNVPATDTSGYAGLADEVDYHTWALLKGVALSTLLGISTQLTLSGQSDLVTAIRQSTQDSVNQAGQQITEKSLGIQPTITVRPGWPLRVIVHKDLVLQPYAG